MLTLVHGPFHPHLERAFREELAALKRDDPLRPVVVLAPSRRLVDRLRALALEAFPAGLAHVRFLPFVTFAARVYAEIPGAPVPVESEVLPRVAVARALVEHFADSPRLGPMRDFAGLAAVLHGTVRDLQDARVDPVEGVRAIAEGAYGKDDGETLAELFRLQLLFREILERERIADGAAVLAGAAARAPASPAVTRAAAVIVYGFYDMTGAQAEFFEALWRATDVRCFVPYAAGDPAYAFVEPFVARLLGAAQETRVAGAGGRRPARVRLATASGRGDECWHVAKEVLRLVEEERVLPGQIAIVARTLGGGVGEAIVSALEENAIPVAVEKGPPVLRQPIAKAVAQAVGLAEAGFSRRVVVELVSSPFFRAGGREKEEPRPDLWDVLSRRLGIRGGAAAWRARLDRAAQRGKDVPLDARDPEGEPGGATVPIAEVRRLRERATRVIDALQGLPEESTWGDYADRYGALLDRLFDLEDADPDARRSWDAILATLEDLRACDRLRAPVPRRFFADTFLRSLAGCAFAADPEAPGVRVLDAMAARGLSFPIVFAVGMNEGVFPRSLREEPFLRDRLRRRLNEVPGGSLSEKLRGFEEERLLFRLLEETAERELIFSWQRSDENGRLLAPSLYLRAFLEAAEEGKLERVAVPLGVASRLRSVPWSRLTPAEAATLLPLAGRSARDCLRVSGRRAEDFAHAESVMERLDVFGALTAHDGLVEDHAGWWQRRVERGISPTALETFAKCPFQFFAKHVLALEPLPEPEGVADLSAADQGTVAHLILERTVRALLRRDGYARTAPDTALEVLRVEAERAFSAFEADHPTGFPLLWTARKRVILAGLEGFLTADLVRARESGFEPAWLEAAADAVVELEDGDLRFFGKMDRLELRRGPGTIEFRVRDYKTGERPADLVGGVEKAIAKGKRLQLPVYQVIGAAFLRGEQKAGRLAKGTLVPAGAAYEYLAISGGDRDEVALEGDFWGGAGAEPAKKTLGRFVAAIQRGEFFIHPSGGSKHGHCAWCPYATLCRKEHLPSARRAEEDPRFAAYREIVG